MPNKPRTGWLAEEVASFLASRPSADQLLAYRPSARAALRLRALLAKSRAGALTTEERWELDQFEHVEMLMQSIKANLRPTQPVRA